MSSYNNIQHVGKVNEYKYVYKIRNRKTNDIKFIGSIKSLTGHTLSMVFDTAKEAAKYIDLCLINMRKEPVNVLKRIN